MVINDLHLLMCSTICSSSMIHDITYALCPRYSYLLFGTLPATYWPIGMRIISRTITKPVTEHRQLVRRRKGSISYICHWIPTSGADLKKSNAKIISGSTKTYLNWINVGGKVSHDNLWGNRGCTSCSVVPRLRQIRLAIVCMYSTHKWHNRACWSSSTQIACITVGRISDTIVEVLLTVWETITLLSPSLYTVVWGGMCDC